MFEKNKKAVAVLAVAAVLSACGGGGGDSGGPGAGTGTQSGSTGTSGSGTNTGTPAGGGTGTSGGTTNTGSTGNTGTGGQTTTGGGSNSPVGGGTGSGTGTGGTGTGGTGTGGTGTGGTGTGGTGTGGTTAPASETQLKGYLGLVASQLIYIKGNRSIYFPVALEQFESATGIYDFASGSKTDITNVTIPTPARSPAAPLAAFGFRIEKYVQRTSPTQDVSNQVAVGRIAFNLEEKPGTAGVQAGEQPEQIRFVLDKVEIASNANGEIVSARVQDGGQLTVYGKNAAGAEVRTTLPVPSGAVKLVPLAYMLDPEGDTTSIMLVVDLETAFSQAGDKLAALENFAGQFSMQMTMSFAQLVRPGIPASGSTPAVTQRDLVGQPISVNGLAPVSGWGVSGNAWVRMYPPQ